MILGTNTTRSEDRRDRSSTCRGADVIPVRSGEIHATKDKDQVLVAHGLGSCVAIAAYDPSTGAGAMAHVQMPSRDGGAPRGLLPATAYADVAIEVMASALQRLGAIRKYTVISLVGGARTMSDRDMFQIGERNILDVRRHLWRIGYLVAATDVGGTHWRTARLLMDTGTVVVRTAEKEEVLRSGHQRPDRR